MNLQKKMTTNPKWFVQHHSESFDCCCVTCGTNMYDKQASNGTVLLGMFK